MRFALLAIALTMFGCGSALDLQRSISANRYTLYYLHDSRPVPNKTSVTIYLDSIYFEDDLEDSVVVCPIRSTVLPLLFKNSWKFDYECDLGKNVLLENQGDFIRKSLSLEAGRSGLFKFVSTPDSAQYSIDVTIRDSICCGLYSQHGHLNFWLIYPFIYGEYHEVERSFPGNAIIFWRYTLKKSNVAIYYGGQAANKEEESVRPYPKSIAQLGDVPELVEIY
jgi:hypothetical protein